MPNGKIRKTSPENNKLRTEDFAAHNWYRFVLSFPPHLVRDYIKRFHLAVHPVKLDVFQPVIRESLTAHIGYVIPYSPRAT